jgi:hypothetical protein
VSEVHGQGLERFLNGVAGVEVAKGANLPKENGTGFVVSVDGGTISVLTARHLFYAGRDRFTQDISVSFFVDKLRAYPAVLATDSPKLDLAVLTVANVPQAVRQQFPTFSVRPDSNPLSIGDTLHVFGGKSQSWQVSTDTISDIGDGDSTDGFRFDGNGIRGGFSGAPVLGANGLLTGVHLGATDDEGTYGRAVRMSRAYDVLSRRLGVTMNKVDFGQAMGGNNRASPPTQQPAIRSPGRTTAQGSDPNAGAVSAAISQPGAMERYDTRLGLRADLKIQNASDTLRWYQSAKAIGVNPTAFNQIAGHESPKLLAKITAVNGRSIRANEMQLRYLTPVLYFDIDLSGGPLDFEPRAGMYVVFRGTPTNCSAVNAGSGVECRLSVVPGHFLEIEPTF